jgi:hypothetical protein
LSAGFQEGGFGSAPPGSAGPGAGSGLVADPGQQAPLVCPQLVFRPLIGGCESLLNPITRQGLASTGLSILLAVSGLLAMGAGWLVYRRSSARAGGMRPISSAGIGFGPAPRISPGLIARLLAFERVRR